MEISEVYEIVYSINQEMFNILTEETPDCYIFGLDVTDNGYVICVDFLGINLWNSDDDEREEISEDVYEPLEGYLRRRIKEIGGSYQKLLNGIR